MSQQLRNHSSDLLLLQEEGFDFVIAGGRLIVREVPYRNSNGKVGWGALCCPLSTNGDITAQPSDHTMYFAGEMPHDTNGESLEGRMVAGHVNEQIDGISFTLNLSRMPDRGYYLDYHEKVTAYCSFICPPAEAIDSSAVPRRFNPHGTDDPEDVFLYLDTNAARSDTVDLNTVFKGHRIGIIGVGGTGSYVLDLVAKCRVDEVQAFDGDTFKDHNAFRAPGAASVEDLKAHKPKVIYFAERYSTFRLGIVAVPEYITEENLQQLHGLTFVFLCMDPSPSKKRIIEYLQESGTPFIDSGIGIHRQSSGLAGLVRVTKVSSNTPERFINRIPVRGDGDDGVYETNIQVAEVNAMAAVLSVLAWKRYLGFYDDLEGAVQSVYVLDGNIITNRGGQSEPNREA